MNTQAYSSHHSWFSLYALFSCHSCINICYHLILSHTQFQSNASEADDLRKHCGERRIAHHKQFLLLSQCFRPYPIFFILFTEDYSIFFPWCFLSILRQICCTWEWVLYFPSQCLVHHSAVSLFISRQTQLLVIKQSYWLWSFFTPMNLYLLMGHQ